MSLFRKLNSLSFFFLIGIIFLLYILICTIYIYFQTQNNNNEIVFTKPKYLFELYSTVIFTYTCHNSIPDILQVFIYFLFLINFLGG